MWCRLMVTKITFSCCCYIQTTDIDLNSCSCCCHKENEKDKELELIKHSENGGQRDINGDTKCSSLDIGGW